MILKVVCVNSQRLGESGNKRLKSERCTHRLQIDYTILIEKLKVIYSKFHKHLGKKV